MSELEITTMLNSTKNQEQDFFTTEEAAIVFGLKYSQAHALLGEPDNIWFTATGQTQYVYLKSRVYEIKNRRDEKLRKKQSELGKRSCYYCRNKFEKKDLCDGLCADCHARKLVKNFACRGNCFRYELDIQRLNILKKAISQIEDSVGN